MDFGIVAFPRKDVQDTANSFRKRYDPHYTFIPPHITLKEKFTADEEDLSHIVPKLSKIAKESQPFTIQINKVSHFHPVTSTIYLAIDEQKPLHDLHQKIHDIFPNTDHPYEFIPHVTIGQKMREEELHDVYGRLRMQTFDLFSIIDRFHLMYQLENKSWSIHQSFIFSDL
ncbi:2'-5' RNA ligase [Seinonella peptonophila]|uniref:Putative phosphoesterase SAMN05444392_102138 n=1 Tax=Seinonella peptonophila TaxID=112248 RepID=A0A1M4V2T3_9BACL|nr:2'-5' RNA ligase family protein [Seinonella peptonophila]SHE63197.1 2'-5' RNA ligase [Seinonella peptonophila]